MRSAFVFGLYFRAVGGGCLRLGWACDFYGRAFRLNDGLRDAYSSHADFHFPRRGELAILFGFVDRRRHKTKIVLPLLVFVDAYVMSTIAIIMVDLAKNAVYAAFNIKQSQINFIVPSGTLAVHEFRSARRLFLLRRSFHDFISCSRVTECSKVSLEKTLLIEYEVYLYNVN